MIEVICQPTGDRAEAEDEASAVVAAITLLDDAWIGVVGEKPTCTFVVDGVHVRSGVRRTEVLAALAAI